jgi:hypothetical protein
MRLVPVVAVVLNLAVPAWAQQADRAILLRADEVIR